jgi:hypothetical protein
LGFDTNVVLWAETDVSEEHFAAETEDGGSIFVRNVDNCPQNYTVAIVTAMKT